MNRHEDVCGRPRPRHLPLRRALKPSPVYIAVFRDGGLRIGPLGRVQLLTVGRLAGPGEQGEDGRRPPTSMPGHAYLQPVEALPIAPILFSAQLFSTAVADVFVAVTLIVVVPAMLALLMEPIVFVALLPFAA